MLSDKLMSEMGQKRTSDFRPVMSALPLKADIAEHDRHVRFVPKADIPAKRRNRALFDGLIPISVTPLLGDDWLPGPIENS
jgi:hypothetical protein